MAKSQIKYIPKQPLPKVEAPKQMPAVVDSKNTTCNQVFWGVAGGGYLLAGALVFIGVKNSIDSYHSQNWLALGLSVVLAIFGVITAIGTLRAALVMAVMMAARTFSYGLCAAYCEQAIKYRRIIPGGVAWAVQTWLEFKVQQGAFDEVAEVGAREYEIALARNPKEYSLGSICACVGTAYNVKGDNVKAAEWLEKAITQYKIMFEQLEKGKKGAKKEVKIPGGSDGVYLRYAETYLGLASTYLSMQDKRNAKDRASQVYDIAKKVKDGPDKDLIIKRAQEIVKMLKHW